MWSIKINDIEKNLELAPGTALTYTTTNPAFDPEQTENSYTFSFTVPASPHNVSIIRYANRLDRRDIIYPFTWSAVLILEGVPFKYGELKLLKNTERDFEMEFVTNTRKILEALDKISLKDLSQAVRYPHNGAYETDKGFRFHMAETPDAFVSTDWWLGITIKGQYFKSTVWSWSTWTGMSYSSRNAALDNFVIQINTAFGFPIAATTGDNTGPYYYLLIRDVIYELKDSDVVSESLLRPDQGTINSLLRKQQMWADVNADTLIDNSYDYVFPVTFSPVVEAEDDFPRQIFYNLASGSKFWFHFPVLKTGHAQFRVGQYVPMAKTRWIFEELANKLGITQLLGDPLNDVDVQEVVLFSNLNMAREQAGNFQEYGTDFDQPTLVPLIEWDLGWALPDRSAKDFWLIFCEYFGIYWKPMGDNVIFVRKIDQFLNYQEDWTSKCEPSWLREFNTQGDQILKYKEIEGIPPIPGQLEPKGTDGDIIELPANTLPYGFTSNIQLAELQVGGWVWDANGRSFKAPYWAGKTVLAGLDGDTERRNTCNDFIFLFWRGTSHDSEGDDYSFATHDTLDYDNNSIGTLDLDMNAASYSIYELRWKDIFNVKKYDRIKIPVRLGVQDLINMEEWTHTIKRIYTNLGSILGVVLSVEAQFISDVWQNEVVCSVEMAILR